MYQKSSTCFQLDYPCIRDELLRVLHQISNAEAQRQNWVKQEALARSDTNRLSALLQFVYISAGLAAEPHFTIGLFLTDVDEARSVSAVFDAVERVFQTVGVDATCEIYIACSEWSKLVQAVDRALQNMQNNLRFSGSVDRKEFLTPNSNAV